MKLLIAGIDPGTTVGYALIDLNGNAVSIGSEKHLDLNALIAKIVKIGRVLVVGTDKGKLPSFVEKFANALGSRIVKPDSDLGSKDKQELVKGYSADDDHQLDALAAAVFSFKKLRSLFAKIESFIETYGKQKTANKITELVVLKGMSIKEASDLLEKPDKEESKIIAKVIEQRKFEEKDFLRLYSKLKQIEKENSLLRHQNNKFKDEIRNLEKPREKKKPYEKKFNELLKFREKRVFILERELSAKEADIDALRSDMNKLCYFLSALDKNVLLKKLDNLGNVELEKKEKLLNIAKGDVLLVDDPNIISENTISKIKNKVFVIIYNNKPGKKVAELPFLFINSKKLDIKEDRYFAVVSKESFENEKSKLDVLTKVIHDYKKERSG